VRVELTHGVFGAPDTLMDLISLLRSFAAGRHDWVAEPSAVDVARAYFAEHAPSLAATCADLAMKGTVAGQAWTPAAERSSLVRVHAEDLHEHVEDLCRSAVLVVEDQDSDGRFIHALAVAFGADRILLALQKHWLAIDHGGGSGGVAKVAKIAAARFHRCARVAALFDSDRLVPGTHTGSYDKAKTLVEAGIVVHVLALREAENYVPNRVLFTCDRKPSQASRKLDALKTLTPAQRGHFDMKHGFRNSVPAEQSELFARLDPKVTAALKEGFGSDLLHRMDAMSGQLTESDFTSIAPDIVAEIRSLLGEIAKVI